MQWLEIKKHGTIHQKIPKRYSEDSLEAVVVKLVVTGEGDQTTPGRTKSEEDLHRCCHPGLLHMQHNNALLSQMGLRAIQNLLHNNTPVFQVAQGGREKLCTAAAAYICHTQTHIK